MTWLSERRNGWAAEARGVPEGGGRGLRGERMEEGAGRWARVALSGLFGPRKASSWVFTLFYCKGTTSGRVPGTRGHLGDPKDIY